MSGGSPLVVLGLDPGTNSFAYCVLEVKGVQRGVLNTKVLQHGMLNATMRDLKLATTLRAQREAFKAVLYQILSDFSVTHIVAERYMIRRGQGGTAIEAINIMIGVLLETDLPTKLIPASQWKNEVSRRDISLDDIYLEVKAAGITPHQTDACHIATYGANLLRGEKPFQFKGLVQKILRAPKINLGQSTKIAKKRPKKRKKAKK